MFKLLVNSIVAGFSGDIVFIDENNESHQIVEFYNARGYIGANYIPEDAEDYDFKLLKMIEFMGLKPEEYTILGYEECQNVWHKRIKEEYQKMTEVEQNEFWENCSRHHKMSEHESTDGQLMYHEMLMHKDCNKFNLEITPTSYGFLGTVYCDFKELTMFVFNKEHGIKANPIIPATTDFQIEKLNLLLDSNVKELTKDELNQKWKEGLKKIYVDLSKSEKENLWYKESIFSRQSNRPIKGLFLKMKYEKLFI